MGKARAPSEKQQMLQMCSRQKSHPRLRNPPPAEASQSNLLPTRPPDSVAVLPCAARRGFTQDPVFATKTSCLTLLAPFLPPAELGSRHGCLTQHSKPEQGTGHPFSSQLQHDSGYSRPTWRAAARQQPSSRRQRRRKVTPAKLPLPPKA